MESEINRIFMTMVLSRKKEIVPMIMWLVLFAGIIVLSFIRINNLFGNSNDYPTYLDIIFIVFYLIWMVIELRVTKKDMITEEKKTYDFMTCQLYGSGQAIIILTALWIPSVWRIQSAAHFVGIIISILAACYRLWAIRTLGRFYSHRVRAVSKHQIVTSGPYSVIRHPAYAGMLIANAGISLYFFNVVTVCVFLFILIPAVILRIIIEEKMLFKIEGYSEYAKSKKRLLPSIW